MPKIDLIYDPDCPNVDHARARLRQAITEYGQPLQWTEWVSDDRSLPDYASGHGSPTILVDERDVSAAPARSRSCRMYEQPNGTLDPAPPVAAILAAFSRAL